MTAQILLEEREYQRRVLSPASTSCSVVGMASEVRNPFGGVSSRTHGRIPTVMASGRHILPRCNLPFTSCVEYRLVEHRVLVLETAATESSINIDPVSTTCEIREPHFW